jgi:hypothetical protein
MVFAEDTDERARDSTDLRVPVCSVMDTLVIKALIAGERDPREPATLVRGRMKPRSLTWLCAARRAGLLTPGWDEAGRDRWLRLPER